MYVTNLLCRCYCIVSQVCVCSVYVTNLLCRCYCIVSLVCVCSVYVANLLGRYYCIISLVCVCGVYVTNLLFVCLFVCLFVLRLSIPVNNFSVMSAGKPTCCVDAIVQSVWFVFAVCM